jgi:hypothetical protein
MPEQKHPATIDPRLPGASVVFPRKLTRDEYLALHPEKDIRNPIKCTGCGVPLHLIIDDISPHREGCPVPLAPKPAGPSVEQIRASSADLKARGDSDAMILYRIRHLTTGVEDTIGSEHSLKVGERMTLFLKGRYCRVEVLGTEQQITTMEAEIKKMRSEIH